jgi:hypothetical protein
MQQVETYFQGPYEALPLESSETRGWPGWGARQPFFLFVGLSGTGFSLWGLILASIKPHRLKPVPPNLLPRAVAE